MRAEAAVQCRRHVHAGTVVIGVGRQGAVLTEDIAVVVKTFSGFLDLSVALVVDLGDSHPSVLQLTPDRTGFPAASFVRAASFRSGPFFGFAVFVNNLSVAAAVILQPELSYADHPWLQAGSVWGLDLSDPEGGRDNVRMPISLLLPRRGYNPSGCSAVAESDGAVRHRGSGHNRRARICCWAQGRDWQPGNAIYQLHRGSGR